MISTTVFMMIILSGVLDVHILCIKRLFLNDIYKPRLSLILHHRNAQIATKLPLYSGTVLKMIGCATKKWSKCTFNLNLSRQVNINLLETSEHSVWLNRKQLLICNYIIYVIKLKHSSSFQAFIKRHFNQLVLKTHNWLLLCIEMSIYRRDS